jgi:ABC-type phosphate transport system substrate-binding protein
MRGFNMTAGTTFATAFLVAPLCAVAVLTAAIPVAEAEGPDDILVIGNKNVDSRGISKDELKAMFLKKKATVGGSKVIPLNAPEGSSLRKEFRKAVLGMTATEEQAYWEELKVKKAVSGPAEFGNTLKAVYSVKGGIGYCRRSQYKEGVVKILAVL